MGLGALSGDRLRGWPWYFVLVLVLVVVDQWSKHWVVLHLDYLQSRPLMSFLNFTHVHNPGAAFSFLADGSVWQRWLLRGLSLGMSVFFLGWIVCMRRSEVLLAWAISLIAAGAIGNGLDRFFKSSVIDFIDVHFYAWHFYTFNLADSFITLGAALFVANMLFFKSEKAH